MNSGGKTRPFRCDLEHRLRVRPLVGERTRNKRHARSRTLRNALTAKRYLKEGKRPDSPDDADVHDETHKHTRVARHSLCSAHASMNIFSWRCNTICPHPDDALLSVAKQIFGSSRSCSLAVVRKKSDCDWSRASYKVPSPSDLAESLLSCLKVRYKRPPLSLFSPPFPSTLLLLFLPPSSSPITTVSSPHAIPSSHPSPPLS